MFRRSAKKTEEPVERLNGTLAKLHGHKGDALWPAPRLVCRSTEATRADQGNTIEASEYLDEPEVLHAKVDAIVALLKKAKCCTAYTGAGLSRAAGIGDYASKKNSINSDIPKLKSNLDAQPTYSHKVLVALERAGYLHQYVQQNHDGLPQKAGFPQEKINEIHGAWYDPSNPVVQFSGNLRGDLYEWMEQIEKQTDLCLCLGTSLSGMNADRIAETPARRSLKTASILGTVIINLQQTKLDSKSTIRVWAKLDDTFKLIAEKLQLDMSAVPIDPPKEYKDQFIIPYNKEGRYDPSCQMIWDLRDHQEIYIQNPEASNYKQKGEIFKKDKENNYVVHVGRSGYRLGRWWVQCVMQGKWPYHLPFVNLNAKIKKVQPEAISLVDSGDIVMEDAKQTNVSITVKQTHESIGGDNHSWSLFVDNCEYVQQVTWHLHSTFRPPVVVCTLAPFSISRTGWGVFTVKFEILLKSGQTLCGKHKLSFSQDKCETLVHQ